MLLKFACFFVEEILSLTTLVTAYN